MYATIFGAVGVLAAAALVATRQGARGAMLEEDRATSADAVLVLEASSGNVVAAAACPDPRAVVTCTPDHCGYALAFCGDAPRRWLLDVHVDQDRPTRCTIRAGPQGTSLFVHPLNVETDVSVIRSGGEIELALEDGTPILEATR